MDYTKLSLLEVIELLKTKKVTSYELTKQMLDKIKVSKINAFTQVFYDDSLNQAKQWDSKRENGETLPVLAGVPISVKDNINVLGYKTTCASKFLQDGYVSPYSATLAQNLLDAGAIIIGKNNLDEFAMGSSTEHSAIGVTKNPHNEEFVSGGSSGGSAASVAGGMSFASVGTDTGGSIRQPASFCGVVGLKPTYGTVSRYGVVAFASSLDQAGPITKTVKDAALMLDVMTSYDDKDSTSIKRNKPEFLKNLNPNVKGLKVGLIKEFFEHELDSELQSEFNYVVEWFKSNGAEVKEISMPNINNALSVYYIISSAECASNLSRFDGVRYGVRANDYNNLIDLYYKSRTQGFGKEVKRRIMLGNYVLSSGYYDAYYKKAKDVQTVIVKEFEKVFEDCDVVLSPTSPTPAFKIGERINDPMTMYLADIFTVPVNIAGLPAISVPMSKSSKNAMPFGLQIIAKKFDEQTLLNVASCFETEFKEAK